MAMQYHVTCVPEGLKFIVTVDNKEDVVSQIRTKVNARDTDTLHIQLYNQDWDDYIDVDESEIESKFPNRAKLKVYVVSTLPKISSINTPCNTDGVLKEEEQPPLPKKRKSTFTITSATIGSQLLESQFAIDGIQPLQPSNNDSDQAEELTIDQHDQVDCDSEAMTSAGDKR